VSEKYELEAIEILKVVEQYFPKILDGKDCINWLHKYSTQKKQHEWAGFFFENYCFSLITHFLGGWKGPRIIKGKRFDYQKEFVWDFKLESNKDKNGRKKNWAPLNDITQTNRIIQSESGIGYIIAKADFTFDDGSLQIWRDEKEGRTTARTNSRVLKKRGKVTDLYAIFINNMNQMRKARRDGWIKDFAQGHNIGGASRKLKHQIRLDEIPEEFIIRLPN